MIAADCGPASTSGAAHTHGQYMPFFVTLGSHAYLVKSSVSSLDELENLYIGAFHMGSWRRYLKRRTKDGFPIRPALFAVFVDGLPGVPTVGGPLDEPCGEWRQLQHISELHEGCVVTPMHLAWRAIARVRCVAALVGTPDWWHSRLVGVLAIPCLARAALQPCCCAPLQHRAGEGRPAAVSSHPRPPVQLGETDAKLAHLPQRAQLVVPGAHVVPAGAGRHPRLVLQLRHQHPPAVLLRVR